MSVTSFLWTTLLSRRISNLMSNIYHVPDELRQREWISCCDLPFELRTYEPKYICTNLCSLLLLLLCICKKKNKQSLLISRPLVNLFNFKVILKVVELHLFLGQHCTLWPCTIEFILPLFFCCNVKGTCSPALWVVPKRLVSEFSGTWKPEGPFWGQKKWCK